MKSLDQITLKIFLRTDIWDRITEAGFREASHITAALTISWDRRSLLQLMMRRILINSAIADFYGVDQDTVFGSLEQQEALLTRTLPDQVDAGRNPKTYDWMLSRTRDGSGNSAPRELIHLLSSLRDSQLRRIEIGHDEPPEEIWSRPSCRGNWLGVAPAGVGCYAAITSWVLSAEGCAGLVRSSRRRRSISATVFGFIFTSRQPRLVSSSTAQMSDSAEVSPGNRPITLVRRRTSTNVLSSRFVVLIRLRCWEGNRRWVIRAGRSFSMTAIAEGYAAL